MCKVASLADGVVKDVPHVAKYTVTKLVNKITIKYTTVSALYHYDTPYYLFFFIFASFSRFSWNLYRPHRMQILDEIVRFSCSHFSQTEQDCSLSNMTVFCQALGNVRYLLV